MSKFHLKSKQYSTRQRLSGFCPGTRVSRYQKGKINVDVIEARDIEWQWYQLGNMQICSSPRQITTPAPQHSFLRAGCPSCRPTNSVKALKYGHGQHT